MPPRIWMPNVPMILRLKPPPNVKAVEPPLGAEGTFVTNEVIIDTVKSMTKIEARMILEAVYGVQVTGIHSLNRMGNRRNEQTRMPRKDKDFKRFFVRLSTDVELPNVPKAIEKLKKES